MSKYNTNSLRDDNFENLYYINILQMVEAEETNIKRNVGQLKEDNVYLLNNMNNNFQD